MIQYETKASAFHAFTAVIDWMLRVATLINKEVNKNSSQKLFYMSIVIQSMDCQQLQYPVVQGNKMQIQYPQ